jgi:hypothetical protein
MGETEKPKETERDYCEAVGHALSTWSVVEQNAYQIFGFVLGNPQAAYHAYWEIHSFEERLKMTHAAFRGRFRDNTDLMGTWKKLRKRMIDENLKRNDIAHGTVLGVVEPGKAPRFKLVPFMWASFGDPNKQPHDDGMTLQEVQDAERAFKALWMDLSAFLGKTLAKLNQPKEADPEPRRSRETE